MSEAIVAVIGTGVIGTSVGLALKQNSDPPTVIGHDKEPKNARQAMSMGAFDRSEWNLINATEPADLIILALPSPEIEDTLKAIAPYLKQDAIISDTSESKQAIMALAKAILPDHVHFVGGNPIVRAEPGPENARADLFQKQLYCLTPASSTLPEAVQLLEDFVALIGATSYFLDPVEHDGLMSGVNMLPALLSAVLVSSVSQQASWGDMRRLAGGLFSHVSSGAVGNPDALVNRLLENKENSLRWLDISMATLAELKNLIQAEEREPLAQTLDEAFVTRYNWQRDFEKSKLSNLYEPLTEAKVEEPGMFQRMFGGGLLGNRKRGKGKNQREETDNTNRRA